MPAPNNQQKRGNANTDAAKDTERLVFMRADQKDRKDSNYLSIANKKFMHYNDEVLVPFIRAIREALGWKKGQPVPECLKAVSWSDGDIGQLQTLIFEAREALDEAEMICRNKHSAAATGTQQPCDLSPVFRLLKQLQLRSTAKDDVACGLAERIDKIFSTYLREKGLNLDGNPRKKRDLLLAKRENVSVSPGFESLGLRVN
eukprot:CAMPEP_0183773492 /NCGR_PEP_ID=MMETSP0739-20130205/39167_1 /TAXON_ID=385413 /ORGANISM="Thalassiosira miniscula, Strain CCMP1093" /LENGTH=201 /DNA_ID=CAMNT_0026014477 /DNA_START=100 /DNA_END=702 /DNA_ORIENTATION=+